MEKPSEIPPDVMRLAAAAVFEFETRVQSGEFSDASDKSYTASDSLLRIIARAIAAERERATAAERARCERSVRESLNPDLFVMTGPAGLIMRACAAIRNEQ